jgi:hypothetical protein
VSDPVNPKIARVVIDRIDDEALATKIAQRLKKPVIVSDATGRQNCIVLSVRKLDS